MRTFFFFTLLCLFGSSLFGQVYSCELSTGVFSSLNASPGLSSYSGGPMLGAQLRWKATDSFFINPQLNYHHYIDGNSKEGLAAWSTGVAIEFDSVLIKNSMRLSLGWRGLHYNHHSQLDLSNGKAIDYSNNWTRQGFSIGCGKSIGSKWVLYANYIHLINRSRYSWTFQYNRLVEIGLKWRVADISPKTPLQETDKPKFYINTNICTLTYEDYLNRKFNGTGFEIKMGTDFSPNRYIGLFTELGIIYYSDLMNRDINGQASFYPGSRSFKLTTGTKIQFAFPDNVKIALRAGISLYRFGSLNRVSSAEDRATTIPKTAFIQFSIQPTRRIEPFLGFAISKFDRQKTTNRVESYAGSVSFLELGTRIFLGKQKKI